MTWQAPHCPTLPWVYPRVGGGTSSGICQSVWTLGLSPRGRGNLVGDLPERLDFRSIPAWAGEPQCSDRAVIARKVYPRVGGGTLNYVSHLVWQLRSIPAWAGEPSPTKSRVRYSTVYPRVGGGTPWSRPSVGKVGRVFPRVGGGTGHREVVLVKNLGLSPRARDCTRTFSWNDPPDP